MARPRLSINNCWAAKRWPEPEVYLNLTVGELGLDRCQLSADLLVPGEDDRRELEAVLVAAKRVGLNITSYFTGAEIYNRNMLLHPDLEKRLKAFACYQAMVALSERLMCPMVGGHLGAYSVRDYEDPARRSYLEGMLMEFIQDLSVQAGRTACVKTLLWEPMPVAREVPHSIGETRRLVELANKKSHVPVLVCLDLGHCCAGDLADPREHDPLSWLEALGDRVAMVHLQQTDGLADHHWPFNEACNARGLITAAKARQIVDWTERSGRDELELVLEVIHPAETPDRAVLADLEASVRWWKTILGQD